MSTFIGIYLFFFIGSIIFSLMLLYMVYKKSDLITERGVGKAVILSVLALSFLLFSGLYLTLLKPFG